MNYISEYYHDGDRVSDVVSRDFAAIDYNIKNYFIDENYLEIELFMGFVPINYFWDYNYMPDSYFDFMNKDIKDSDLEKEAVKPTEDINNAIDEIASDDASDFAYDIQKDFNDWYRSNYKNDDYPDVEIVVNVVECSYYETDDLINLIEVN